MSFGNASASSTSPSFDFGVSPVKAPSFNYEVSPVYTSQESSLNYEASSPDNPSQENFGAFRGKKKSYTDTNTQTEGHLCVIKFMEGLKGLLQSGQYSDIILNVKNKEFKVHTTVLAAHSPVFAAMMEHNTREKATGIVNIEDGEPDIFADFLHILYSGSTQNLNSENVIDLYIVADKYQVSELTKACKFIPANLRFFRHRNFKPKNFMVNFCYKKIPESVGWQLCKLYMMRQISLEIFCDVTVISLRYHDKELLEVATKYFLQNSLDIVKTAEWLVFLKENVVAGNELILKAFELQKK